MKPIPAHLAEGPFTRSMALASGVTPKMLRGARFRRVHPRVYVVRDHPMSWDAQVRAAELALPDRARLTGISRIQRAGLDYGRRLPIRFVVEGDLHLAIDGIFLHRTRLLPPVDEHGVTIEAAFIAYCALARVIDAIKVGDWLLHHRHMDAGLLADVAAAHPWRAGAQEAMWVSNELRLGSWSLKESESRAVLVFAGLPEPELNGAVELPQQRAVGDLLYREFGVVVEYDGAHHQQDRQQYVTDIERYEAFRSAGYRYLTVTDEALAHPRGVTRRVHRELVAGGYAGPPPDFADRWRTLFMRLSAVLGPRDPWSGD